MQLLVNSGTLSSSLVSSPCATTLTSKWIAEAWCLVGSLCHHVSPRWPRAQLLRGAHWGSRRSREDCAPAVTKKGKRGLFCRSVKPFQELEKGTEVCVLMASCSQSQKTLKGKQRVPARPLSAKQAPAEHIRREVTLLETSLC